LKRARVLAVIAAVAAVAVASVALWSFLSVPQEGFPGTQMIMDHPALTDACQNGKPTLILFSTITCPTCVVQEEALLEAMQDYNGSVNYVHLTYATGIEQVFADWTVLKAPTLVFVDKDRMIRYRSDGLYVSADAVRQILESIR
jgi:thiol-disulfide isomerase/thioredoxin